MKYFFRMKYISEFNISFLKEFTNKFFDKFIKFWIIKNVIFIQFYICRYLYKFNNFLNYKNNIINNNYN